MIDRDFWNGRRVLLTGHTGFKGAWAALLLRRLGAEVDGIALAPDSSPNLYDLARPLCAQPCVAKGSLYLASAGGELIRLDTGRDDADGWYMWGGNARHNLAADA